MGSRTVVIINNDELDLVLDEELRRLVLKASRGGDHWYGPYHVVEQCHADQTSLMVVDSLDAKTLAVGMFSPRSTVGLSDEELLRAAADKAGFRLVRKSK